MAQRLQQPNHLVTICLSIAQSDLDAADSVIPAMHQQHVPHTLVDVYTLILMFTLSF
jgi:hypothetical protein